MKALFDTCVIIDVLQHREPFWQDSYAASLAVANQQIKGFITAKSFTDICYLTHRQTHDEGQTRKILSTLLSVFELVDTTAMDCRKALQSDVRDYEDAVMMETAARSGMDCIVTRNLPDYQASPVPVLTPAALLSKISPSA